MADKSSIEWTRGEDGTAGATWNPIVGCSIVSPGCTNCYAMKMAARIEAMHEGTHRPHVLAGGGPAPRSHYEGTTADSKAGAVWTGKVALAPEHILTQPLRWRRGRRIFVNSMGDLFHESVPDEWIDRVFAVMALAPQHTFQVLTKRSARMREYCEHLDSEPVSETVRRIVAAWPGNAPIPHEIVFPLSNVWLGVSAEDQRRADERREDLAALASAGWRTFVSYEPALGAVDWSGWEFLSWLISGGESGPHARPSHPDWHRAARDFCAVHGIPYFFKQWGAWAPQLGAITLSDNPEQSRYRWAEWTDWCASYFRWVYIDRPQWCEDMDPDHSMIHVGKRVAGRLLDGQEHNGMPGGREVVR